MSTTNQDEFWDHIKTLFKGVQECADDKIQLAEKTLASGTQ